MRLPFFHQDNNNASEFLLAANPHYYDYMHYLRFNEDGTVELLDGAGQVINTEANGKYVIREIDGTTAEIEFYDVVETDPYEQGQKIRDIEPFTAKVIREEGSFPFRRETVWRIDNEDEWPCLLFKARYVFGSDPINFGRGNQERNLYYLIENKDLIESARYYYSIEDGQELTAEEMLNLGIPKESFW